MDAPSEPVSRNARLRTAALWLLAFCPFVTAWVCHAIEPRPQQVAPGEPRPGLTFRQYMVNLGRVSPGRLIAATYVFTNTSDRTVEIKKLVPSCGCLNPRLEKMVYEPGESGRFDLRVDPTREQPGEKEYSCRVEYDDGRQRDVAVVFRVTLPDNPVIVQPRALIFYQFHEGETRHDITVTDQRERPLRILNVESSSPDIRLDSPRNSIDERGFWKATITATVKDRPQGQNVLITITTDDPEYRKLYVPVILQATEGAIRQAGHEDHP